MAKRTGKHFHCPVNGWDCPYYKDAVVIDGQEEYCICNIDGDPYEECDDFFDMYGEDCHPDDYTDYVDE